MFIAKNSGMFYKNDARGSTPLLTENEDHRIKEFKGSTLSQSSCSLPLKDLASAQSEDQSMIKNQLAEWGIKNDSNVSV